MKCLYLKKTKLNNKTYSHYKKIQDQDANRVEHQGTIFFSNLLLSYNVKFILILVYVDISFFLKKFRYTALRPTFSGLFKI